MDGRSVDKENSLDDLCCIEPCGCTNKRERGSRKRNGLRMRREAGRGKTQTKERNGIKAIGREEEGEKHWVIEWLGKPRVDLSHIPIDFIEIYGIVLQNH